MTVSKQAKRFITITLGCKVNQCESSAIAQRLIQNGLTAAEPDDAADVCIINTCAVTGKAAVQSCQAVRRVARKYPDAQIIVTGCFAQTDPEVFHDMETSLEVVPHDQKGRIYHHLNREPGFSGSEGALFPEPGDFDIDAPLGRTRPALKIQDGCNAFCTYCVVPYARGRSTSMDMDDAMTNLCALAQSGFHEVVLTGIHLGHYGLDLTPVRTLSDLLENIIQSSLRLRIRLSSIEPNEVTERIIEQVATDERLCNHFHLPLQSGATSVLKRMRRPYTAKAYADTLGRIVRKIPRVGIGADVMVGFPGETDDEFTQSYRKVESLPVSYLHVFPYSRRPGTPAADYPDPVPDEIVKQRAAEMRALGREKQRTFWAKQSGKPATVLVEGRRDRQSGLLKGMTGNYIPVLIHGPDTLMNQMVTVRLQEDGYDEKLKGVLSPD